MLWKREKTPVLTVEELKSLLDRSEEVRLIDVRSAAEYRSGHIDGAVNVPLTQVQGVAAGWQGGPKTVMVCHSGGRSAMACRLVRRALPDAINLVGGMAAWARAGYPVRKG